MSYTLLPNSAVADIIEMIKATFGALSPLVLLLLGLFIGFEVLKIAIALAHLIKYGAFRVSGGIIRSPYEEEDEEEDDEI